MEEFRFLLNFEFDSTSPMALILVGQTELWAEKLRLQRYAAIRQRITYADTHLPENKDIFYIYTHGAPSGNFLKAMREIVGRKNGRELGEYRCQGYDTFGPFKLVGGIAKGHPTEDEIKAAVVFYKGL